MVCDEPCFTVIYNCMNIQYDAEAITGAACGGSSQSAYQPKGLLTGRTCPFK
jgi:hypothetical protein